MCIRDRGSTFMAVRHIHALEFDYLVLVESNSVRYNCIIGQLEGEEHQEHEHPHALVISL